MGSPTVDVTSGDTRLILLDPARAVAAYVVDFRNIELDVGLFAQSVLTVDVHKSSKAATVSYNGTTALAQDWGVAGGAGTDGTWSLDFYVRSARVFSGPVQIVTKDRPGFEGESYVTLVCESWFPALMRRRLVLSDTNAQYTHTDAWDDIFRDLISSNCLAGTEPSSGEQRQAYPADREDFGTFTVAVQADTGTATSATYVTDPGNNLLDSLLEVCTSAASTDDYLWPTVTESPAGTFTIGCTVGRTGGSRAIGTDLSASVIFSTALDNVPSFKKESDGTTVMNVARVTADGIGTQQRVRFLEDTASTTAWGVYEDGLNIAHGETADECDQEAARLLHERKEGWTRWEAEIVEASGLEWPGDFDVADTVVVDDRTWGETVTGMIIGIKYSLPAPGPSHIKLIFGHMPRNSARDIGRSGGGGGGGRGGGGRPRAKSGSAGSDLNAWQTIDVEGATSLVCDQSQDSLGYSGESGSTFVEVEMAAHASDPGAGDGTKELVRWVVVGHPTESDPGGADAYIPIRGSDGNTYRLLAVKVAGAAAASFHV